MNPQFITSANTWDASLKELPSPHVLQSWAWGEFKSRWGWQPTRLLWVAANGKPQAAAQILRRSIPKTPWCMLYVSKGPIWDYTNQPLITQILAYLQDYAAQQKAFFIKIDPDIPWAFEPTEEIFDSAGQAIKNLFQQRGWVYAKQQIQFKNTVLLNLTPSEDELLAKMKSKWRYNIRLAKRKGVTIKQAKTTDLESFYTLYLSTAQRDGFLIRPKAYYLDLWQQYLQLSQQPATLLLATVNDKLVAGLMLFYFGTTAWYMYGASLNEYRQTMPNHLLQWEAIKTAKARGCVTYDMWGAPDVFDESDSMWGVYRFKKGFAGITRQGLGAYDYPVSPLKYKLYSQALPKILALLRRGIY